MQSNISTRLKQLEEQLGKTLFLRQNRGLTLTADGQLLLSYTERLLELSLEASEALAPGKPTGAFRIGSMESTAARACPTSSRAITSFTLMCGSSWKQARPVR